MPNVSKMGPTVGKMGSKDAQDEREWENMSGKPAIKAVSLRIHDHNDAIRDAIVSSLDMANMATPIAPENEGPSAKIKLKGGLFDGRSVKCDRSSPAVCVWHENSDGTAAVFWYVAKEFAVRIVPKSGTPYEFVAVTQLGDDRLGTTPDGEPAVVVDDGPPDTNLTNRR